MLVAGPRLGVVAAGWSAANSQRHRARGLDRSDTEGYGRETVGRPKPPWFAMASMYFELGMAGRRMNFQWTRTRAQTIVPLSRPLTSLHRPARSSYVQIDRQRLFPRIARAL